MKKKMLLLCCSLLAAITIGAAEVAETAEAEEADAVYAWVDGTSKCYRLSDMPVVSYDQGDAVLTIDGVEQLRVAAESIEQLTITYGVYKSQPDIPTGVEQTEPSSVRKVGKYIIGGQLIIVVDGVQYDANGRVLPMKNEGL